MARVTKRKAKPIAVPTLEQDAAERKRLLNVLAQRRYRERKRHRYEALENQVGSENQSDDNSKSTSPQITEADILSEDNFNFEDNGGDWDTSVLFPSLESPVNNCWSSVTPASSGEEGTSTALTSTKSFDFPDEAFLPMLELNILKAGLAIADRLDVGLIIWDLTALSPFNRSTNLNYDHLPINLRPTFLQLTTPHHPMLDILPWPEVRDKLILVFSQPENLRPPPARSPTALIGFVYDIEDTAEGIRVTGDDPYARENWEVGQKVFERWWWAFTQEIIDHSNSVRENRGATTLTGMVVGEVT